MPLCAKTNARSVADGFALCAIYGARLKVRRAINQAQFGGEYEANAQSEQAHIMARAIGRCLLIQHELPKTRCTGERSRKERRVRREKAERLLYRRRMRDGATSSRAYRNIAAERQLCLPCLRFSRGGAFAEDEGNLTPNGAHAL